MTRHQTAVAAACEDYLIDLEKGFERICIAKELNPQEQTYLAEEIAKLVMFISMLDPVA